jgi:hypothetical protein
MILCIGPINKDGDKQIFLIENGEAVVAKKIPRTKDLLTTLEPLIKKHQAALTGLCALGGNGTFSAVREAVSICNALALTYKIPARSVHFDPATSTPESLEKAYTKATTAFAEPEYSAPPTITTPKK